MAKRAQGGWVSSGSLSVRADLIPLQMNTEDGSRWINKRTAVRLDRLIKPYYLFTWIQTEASEPMQMKWVTALNH